MSVEHFAEQLAVAVEYGQDERVQEPEDVVSIELEMLEVEIGILENSLGIIRVLEGPIDGIEREEAHVENIARIEDFDLVQLANRREFEIFLEFKRAPLHNDFRTGC